MASNLFSGGIITFALIVVSVVVLGFLWKIFFGKRSFRTLLGATSKTIGSITKSAYNLRASSRRKKESEQRFSIGLSRAEQIPRTLKFEADRVASEQDFNPSRVQTMRQQLKTLAEELKTEKQQNQELVKLDSQDISNLKSMIQKVETILSEQNQIEQKLAFLKNRLKQRNLVHSELDQAFNLSEKIKKSSVNLKTPEKQYLQSQQKIQDLIKTRTYLLSQCFDLLSEIENLLKNPAPLASISDIQNNINKLISILNELKNPINSINQILNTLDNIRQQIESELNQMGERVEAEKSIINRVIIFIKEDIAKGKTEKSLAKAA